MEDYDIFVRNRLSHLRVKEEEHKKPASSAILFYGAPILPPVLTGERREEMQQHKKAAQNEAANRRMKANERLAYVQTILHSVQTRHSSTLEDLRQELKDTPTSLDSSCSSASSQQSIKTVAEMNSPHICPVPSTTDSAFFISHVIPQPSHNGGCLVEHRENQQASQPSSFDSVTHCSVSLGCVTHEIMENTNGLSKSLDVGSVDHTPLETTNATDFFLHKTPKTIDIMPDIISYPPIDGEELERSGQESSFCRDFTTMNGSFCTVCQKDPVRGDYFPGDKSGNSQMKSHESQDNLPSSVGVNMKENQQIKQVVVPVLSLDNCSTSNSPVLPQTPSIECSPTDQLIQSSHGNVESVETQSQSPNRSSLQDLLRKSQEYRRQQRMLRNQAKNARIQEKAQEPSTVEEKSLSDKENNEFHYKCTEGRKTKEKRFVKTMNPTCKKYNEKNPIFLDALISKKANRDPERVSQLITLPHPQALSQSQTQKVHLMTSDQAIADPITCMEWHETHHSIPVPHFCLSPVYSKSSTSLPDEADHVGGKVLMNSIHNESHKADEDQSLGLQHDVPSGIVQSSQPINQLEFCLSNLKEVISDLGSSLMEIGGKWQDEGSVGKQDQKNNEDPNRQSLDSCSSMLESTDVQSNKVPPILQDKEKNVNEEALNVSSRQFEGNRLHQPPNKLDEDSHSFTNDPSINRRSFDVDTPSELWLLDVSGSERDSAEHLDQTKELTPVTVAGIEGNSSKVKRRLLMPMGDNLDVAAAPSTEDLSEVNRSCSTYRVASPGSDHFVEDLKQVHAAQVSALQEEHRRQQEELCQALGVRYSLLQGSFFPCSLSGSHHGNALTSAKLSQPPRLYPEHCRHLLLAAVKGYLTRRLLRTERVAQLVRTIGDSRQFLQASQLPANRGDICSKQDRILRQRVSLQLRAARYELYEVFFCLSVAERMHLISSDRELVKERGLRRQISHTSCPKGRSFLSAATQKSLMRKRNILIQKKVSERRRGVVTPEHKTGFTSKQPLENKQGRSRAKPARSSQSWSYSISR
ncbi:centriolar coiled-coil protein of 110 kDa [Syngnathus scovelli]|uniref:centriolar coiled-coil protein of 110 kDa n=1 Tax=Syngnathus scovelli TaxID=161590 RepID=UPI002110AF97|nr:uncharacterized protein si:ch73-100l22.3 [Syngnathus scovelli]